MEEGIPSSCARITIKDGAFGVSLLSTYILILRHSSFLEVSVNRMGDQVKPRRDGYLSWKGREADLIGYGLAKEGGTHTHS